MLPEPCAATLDPRILARDAHLSQNKDRQRDLSAHRANASSGQLRFTPTLTPKVTGRSGACGEWTDTPDGPVAVLTGTQTITRKHE